MNQKKQAKVNDAIRQYLDPMVKIHLNKISINAGCTLEHEIKKCEVCINLAKDGAVFATEAVLKNGKRPDILVLDTSTPIAYEIAASESEESLIRKNTTYGEIKIIPIRVGSKA